MAHLAQCLCDSTTWHAHTYCSLQPDWGKYNSLKEEETAKVDNQRSSGLAQTQQLNSSCVDEHRKLRAALAHEVPLQQCASYHNRTTNPDDDGPTQPHQQCTWHRQQRGTSSCIHNGIVENVHLPHVASVWRPTLPPLWSTWAGDSTWTYISMTWTTHQQGGGTILKPTWVNKLATHIYIYTTGHMKKQHKPGWCNLCWQLHA